MQPLSHSNSDYEFILEHGHERTSDVPALEFIRVIMHTAIQPNGFHAKRPPRLPPKTGCSR